MNHDVLSRLNKPLLEKVIEKFETNPMACCMSRCLAIDTDKLAGCGMIGCVGGWTQAIHDSSPENIKRLRNNTSLYLEANILLGLTGEEMKLLGCPWEGHWPEQFDIEYREMIERHGGEIEESRSENIEELTGDELRAYRTDEADLVVRRLKHLLETGE